MPRNRETQPIAIMTAAAELFHWQREQRLEQQRRAEAYEEGLKGRIRSAAAKGVTPDQIAQVLDMPEDDVCRILGLPAGSGVASRVSGLHF